jgi:hypothetical protein
MARHTNPKEHTMAGKHRKPQQGHPVRNLVVAGAATVALGVTGGAFIAPAADASTPIVQLQAFSTPLPASVTPLLADDHRGNDHGRGDDHRRGNDHGRRGGHWENRCGPHRDWDGGHRRWFTHNRCIRFWHN